MSLKIHIEDDLPGRHIIYYTLQLIAANKGIEFSYVSSDSDADFIIDTTEHSDIILEKAFYQNLTSGKPVFIKSERTQRNLYDRPADFLAAIFYLVNCLQEYHTQTFDKYGRYPYADSFQKKEGLMQTNIVQGLIDDLFKSHPKFSKLNTTRRKSGLFLTHDIDTIYGAKNQNGDHALKTRQYHKIPKLLWNHYTGNPDWINMDKIMAIEADYGFTSTFYWLVRKDKDNADYYIKSEPIQNQIERIKNKGFEIGLHKSLRDSTFAEEINILDKDVQGQRYHFLKFNLPQAWEDLEASRLTLDTSLGFSEDFGFRNSYGLPFMPYNIKEQKVYKLLEVPMNVMDGNFFYQNKTVAQAEKELITWLDKNKENAIITLNFHNNFFDDMLYEGYEKLYIILLKYFKEEGLKCMTQASLLDEFYKPAYYNLKKPIAK